METKNYFSTDAAGNIIPSATCYLYEPGTSTLATGMTNINGAPLANPFTAAPSGLVQFKAPDGEYDLRVTGGGREFTIRIQCFDGVEFKLDLSADDIPYDGETVASVLGNAKSLPSYAALRAYTGIASTIRIINDFRSGRFRKISTTSAGYVDDGGITIIAANGWVWQRINVCDTHVDWFLPQGWVEGVNDDKVAFERAMQYQRAKGGGTARFFQRHLIDTDMYINDLVKLRGPIPSVGEILNGEKAYDKRKGVLLINPAATIRAESSASLSNAILINKSLVGRLPFADLTAAQAGLALFAGNAITPASSDFSLEDCLFLGFNRAFYSVGRERTRINRVMGDCNNGIHIQQSFDVSIVTNCHFWPFLTAHTSFAASISERPGTAFKIFNSDDWAHFTNCFSYGYNRGVSAENSDAVTLTNCAADYDGNLINTTSVGFEFLGTSRSPMMIGCQAASQWRGVVVDISVTDRATAQIIGCQFWNDDEVDIRVNNGNAIISNNTFRGSPTNIYVSATALGATVTGNVFDTPSIRPADGVFTRVIADNNSYINCFDALMGVRKIAVTNTGTFNEIRLVYAGSTNSIYRRANGTAALPTALIDGQAVFSHTAAAYDGTAYKTIAGVRAQTRGAQTTTSAPGALVFSTCASGSAVSTDRWVMDSDASLKPVADAASNLGSASTRINNSFFAVAPTVGSDQRYKTEASPIDDRALDAWSKVDYVQYKLLAAVAEKGDDARLHTGLIAQSVVQAFADEGLDARAYGLLCHDAWEATSAVEAQVDDEGNIVTPAVDAREAGERYGIRYEEALVMEAALMRRTQSRMSARLDALEKASAS